jgi:hypothetical protein
MTMGADLYIASEYDSNNAKWEPVFYRWIEIRKKLSRAGKEVEARKAGEKVDRLYGRMYSKGYFRDSYNDTNLLWKFGLSWWVDMEAFLGKGGMLSPEKARELLKTLAGLENTFKANVRGDKHRKYFEGKYKKFKKFLKSAIEKNEPIACLI